jgi:2-polyprenyl-6-methoxyphenol hydroxylase-like FAD-dependent oxidoreductase
MSDLDVLVVGAGPTGLVMASELLRYGARIRIIEKAPERSGLSRALGVMARTMEIFDDLGIAQSFLAEGVIVHGASMYSGGKQIVRVRFDELDTRHPYAIALPQSDTERILDDLLVRRGGRVERGLELTGLTDGSDGVEATLASGERICARYLVGCDGAHSTTRKAAGLAFEGEPFPDGFLLADVSVDWSLPRDQICTFFNDSGLLACFPLPGGRARLIGTRPYDETDPARQPTLADFQRLVDERTGLAARVSDPVWLAAFRVQSRQVAQYRKGRVFLAGDAAHIHSPVGGQGMNTGIQDAHNLAWKLGLVAGGHAPATLLDSYQPERHKVARAILRSTELATKVATLRHPVARAVRDRMAQLLTSFEVVQERIMRNVAEVDLSYRTSPIVDERTDGALKARVTGDDTADESPSLTAWRRFAYAPRAGDRAPDGHAHLRGEPVTLASLYGHARHLVLLFDGRARTAAGYHNLTAIAAALRERYGERVATYVVVEGADRPAELPPEIEVLLDPDGDLEDRFGAVAECAYVIRPDLYIGHRCQPARREWILQHFEKSLVSRN